MIVENWLAFGINFFVTTLRAISLYLLLPTLLNRDMGVKRLAKHFYLIVILVAFYYYTFYGFVQNMAVMTVLWILFFMYYYYLMGFYTGDLKTAMLTYSMISVLTYPITKMVVEIYSNYSSIVSLPFIGLLTDGMFFLQYMILIKVFLTDKGQRFRTYLGNLFRKFSTYLFIYLIIEASFVFVVNWDSPGVVMSMDMSSYIWFPIVIALLLTSIVYQMEFFITLTNHLEDQVLMQKYYVSSIEELYDDIRRYKHDVNNILLPMGFFIQEKQYDELEKYYFENIERHKALDVDMYHILAHLTNLKIPELKGLVLSKYQLAKQNNIKFSIWINDDISALKMDIVDLCRVVGILLDNAIEGAEDIENGYVLFSMNRVGEEVRLEIANNYDQRTLVGANSKVRSYKGQGRGIGLNSLKQVLNKYSTCSIETSINKEVYHQCVKMR
jgi:two-component system sensor histidine kinase AgrC